MQVNWRSHWLWFCVLLTLVSTADYFDHILRPGAPFGERPFDWLGFTLGSHVTLLVAAFGLAMILRRLPISNLAADVFGVAGAIGFHVLASGPFWNALFWPEGAMTFVDPWQPMLFAGMAYVIYRGVFWLVLKGVDRLRG